LAIESLTKHKLAMDKNKISTHDDRLKEWRDIDIIEKKLTSTLKVIGQGLHN
jgi:hypothetical protein